MKQAASMASLALVVLAAPAVGQQQINCTSSGVGDTSFTNCTVQPNGYQGFGGDPWGSFLSSVPRTLIEIREQELDAERQGADRVTNAPPARSTANGADAEYRAAKDAFTVRCRWVSEGERSWMEFAEWYLVQMGFDPETVRAWTPPVTLEAAKACSREPDADVRLVLSYATLLAIGQSLQEANITLSPPRSKSTSADTSGMTVTPQ
jgi:hypothetical protein